MTELRAAFAAACCAVALSASCADTTPRDFEARDAGVEASVTPAEIAVCRECIRTDDGCRAGYEACEQNATCSLLVTCSLEAGCLTFATLEERIPCVQQCMAQVGISSGVDPAVTLALPVNGCTLPQGACGPLCVRPSP